MTTRIVGPREWRLTRDKDGHREYKLKHVIECSPSDGPGNALLTPGLPLPGSIWSFGGDVDPWAYCTQEAEVSPTITNEPNTQFIIEQTFSTRSPTKCQDTVIEDPLLEPPDISGTFNKYAEEAPYDRFGYPCNNSAHELFRGAQIEFDRNRSAIKIKQNLASPLLAYVLPSAMLNTVNGFSLWGFPPRTIKLSLAPWERKFFGSCNIYYTRTLEFDIDPLTWDKNLLDEGQKVLHGHWDRITGDYVLDLIAGRVPEYYNPQHFDRFKDRQGENCRVILNGHGVPAGVRVVSQRIISAPVNPYAPAAPGGRWEAEPSIAIQSFFQHITGILRRPVGVQLAAAHNLTTGMRITVEDAVGANAAQVNGTWAVDVITATSFALRGSQATADALVGGTYFRIGGVDGILDDISPIVILSTAHGLNTNQRVFLSDTGAVGIDSLSWLITRIDANHFSLQGTIGVSSIPNGTITAASNASPIVITSVAHGRETGQTVTIENVVGNTAANGTYVITVVNADTFSLNASAGNGAYTSGGRWILAGTENVTEDTTPGTIHIEKYTESDFLQLGIPLTF